MHIKNKTGQITVEYILVVTAVLIVIVAFVSNKNGPFQKQMNVTLNTALTEVNGESDQLSGSHHWGTSTDTGVPTGVTVNPTKGL
ncbi:MAG: class III signal peptide-containing protein [Candidatus Omnitrophica bacterium]|nr:class III signal peptide-containing protein [Candidatus Omnitrophota bacterium]